MNVVLLRREQRCDAVGTFITPIGFWGFGCADDVRTLLEVTKERRISGVQKPLTVPIPFMKPARDVESLVE